MSWPSYLPAAFGVLLDGTVSAGVNAAPLAGSSTPCQGGVLVSNDPSNVTGQDIYVGNAASQSVRLQPGQSEQIPINDAAKVYVKAVTGTPRVNWHGCN